MPVHNTDVAAIFEKLANLLDIEGANQFRVRSYRNAARIVETLPQSVSDMLDQGEDLSELPGIGDDLAGKIREIVETGKLSQLQEVEERVPAELNEVLEVAGLGPKRVKKLYEELGIRNTEDLRKAAEAGKVQSLDGFGKKTEQKILDELEQPAAAAGRTKLAHVEAMAEALVGHLKEAEGLKRIMIAGSYRRRKETVGDLDILITCRKDSREGIMDHYTSYEDVAQVVSKGTTRSTIVLKTGLQVDLRVVGEVNYGAALHYFTGSKAHNIAIRKLGVERDLKINEYGVFKGKERIAGRTEEEVFEQVGLPFIEPELREDGGEVEAARSGKLPELVTLDELKGDLHAHTKATDGRHSLEEMAEAAKEMGYEYLAITNHSKHVSVTQGFDEKRMRQQIEEIDELNEKLGGFRILKSIEADILEDGRLDLNDSVLKELDMVVCAVHAKFDLSRDKQTRRILKAMDDPYFHILAHPTGRKINEREPYDVDLEKLMKAALERGCHMELNAHPDRLDLNDHHCKMAHEMGVKIAISTDAHSTQDLQLIRYGVYQARRGWLEAHDVLNTRSWKDLKKLLERK
jgi:DNA polymerase (family 10)